MPFQHPLELYQPLWVLTLGQDEPLVELSRAAGIWSTWQHRPGEQSCWWHWAGERWGLALLLGTSRARRGSSATLPGVPMQTEMLSHRGAEQGRSSVAG